MARSISLTSEEIASILRGNGETVSLGYFLIDYVLEGAELTTSGTRSFTIASGIIVFQEQIYRVQEETFKISSKKPNATYYVDFVVRRGYVMRNERPNDEEYFPLWQVVSDSSSEIDTTTDVRGDTGGLRFKPEFLGVIIDNLVIDGDALSNGTVTLAKLASDVTNLINSKVSSVAGKTGVVTLTASDVGLGNVTNESKTTMFNNSTFTGTTTGVNWVGEVNGSRFTVAATAPTSPTPAADDAWLDTTNATWKRYNGTTWVIIGAGAVSSVAGKTGAVTLVASDVGLGNVTNESKATMFTNSTFTGTTTGVNWSGNLNGIRYTVSATAPTSPTPVTNDIWIDTTNLLLKRYNGTTWDTIGGGGGTPDWSTITNKPTTVSGYGITDSWAQSFANLGSLPTANSTNRRRIAMVQGATGVAEVASLTVSAGATASGDVTVSLGGQDFTVAVLSTDNTATLIATKLRAATYAGWTTGGSGTTVTFTSQVPVSLPNATYSAGTTGATGSMTTTTQGVTATADTLYICMKLANDAYDWVAL